MGIGYFPEVKQPERSADYPNPPSVEAANRPKPYLRLPSVPTEACHGVTFTFTQTL